MSERDSLLSDASATWVSSGRENPNEGVSSLTTVENAASVGSKIGNVDGSGAGCSGKGAMHSKRKERSPWNKGEYVVSEHMPKPLLKSGIGLNVMGHCIPDINDDSPEPQSMVNKTRK